MRILALSLVMLTGCMTTDPARWSGGEPDPARAAVWECREVTRAKVGWAAGFGGAVVPMVALFTMSREFDQCMEAKGFRKGE